MLIEIDRMQLAVPDAAPVIEAWQALLGAQVESTDSVACLGADRTSLRMGRGYIEILTASGPGPVADAIAARGGHMFSAGASSKMLDEVETHVRSLTDKIDREAGQLFIDGSGIGIDGLRLVVSEHEDRPSVGEVDYMYEATMLAADSEGLTRTFAEVFKLDANAFVGIDSPKFGYKGTLTLFKPAELHRFEVISPFDMDKTLGRFFSKLGPILYMGFVETDKMLEIEARANARGDGITVDRPEGRGLDVQADQMWLHPNSLGGVMLGLSRPSMAWSWSGSPERVTNPERVTKL